MDIITIQQAKDYLDELFASLLGEKSGEECINYIERHIRQRDEQFQKAVREALGLWLKDDNWVKIIYSIDLISRFSETEYIPELEKIRDGLVAGTLSLPGENIDFVESVLKSLKASIEKETIEKDR
jgi:hypothetical protein